jgi:hypothetical protein
MSAQAHYFSIVCHTSGGSLLSKINFRNSVKKQAVTNTKLFSFRMDTKSG